MVNVDISEESINRIHALLSGMQNADTKVLKPAITRGLMAGKTQAKREVRKTYRISAGDFNKNAFIKQKNPSQSGSTIIGSIEFSGSVIPLMKFKVTPSAPKGKTAPKAAVLKASSLVAFDVDKDAFVASMNSGHIGVFKRTPGQYSRNRGSGQNKHTEKIQELYSPSAPAMVGNEEVSTSVEERMAEVINERIEHEIDRLLNKYGG